MATALSSFGASLTAGTEATQDINAQVMDQIMRLLESYGLANNLERTSTLSLSA